MGLSTDLSTLSTDFEKYINTNIHSTVYIIEGKRKKQDIL
jgi:hypothetical protein